MPYGVRGRLIATLGSVRTGTYCWLQQLENGQDEQHGLFLGLSPARKMVSFWCHFSQLGRFDYCFFVANHHPRLAFSSKYNAQLCASEVASRAAAGAPLEIDLRERLILHSAGEGVVSQTSQIGQIEREHYR